MSGKSLYDVIHQHLPMERYSSACHAAYISNILQITDYVTYLRKQVLALIINHMIRFDVRALPPLSML